MTDPIVDIQHLSHVYGQRKALDDLSLRVEGPQIVGFLGPNGSGKSTLMRILCTLMTPSSGSVRILGFDLTDDRDEIRRHTGVVFQSPSLDKQLTAEENMRCQGQLYGLRGADLEQRIGEMLGRVGLEARPRELVGKFSGGMRRRVELAKGLLHRPRLLLLDEPSTGLDPAARLDLWRYLRQIHRDDGVTIILTTHLMDEAEHCDRLAILDAGKLVRWDEPAALKAQIGGDVITLRAADPAAVARGIRERFGLEAALVDSTLRLEGRHAPEFIPRLLEAFPGQIESLSLGKPTLEDVFIHATGRRFRAGEASSAEA